LAIFGALGALAYAACVFPEFEYLPEDDATTAGGAGTMMVGGGGTGGDPVGGGGTAGSGGAMGCEATGCAMGEKCAVVDTATGAKDCVSAGPRMAWQRCNVDADCGENLWCDLFTMVCHPICGDVGDCVDGVEPQCIQAREASVPIPSLRICTSDCNPKTAAPCSDSGGQTTCYYNANETYWDCMQTVGVIEYEPCNAVDQCNDGLVCEGNTDTCLRWCTPVNQQADCIVVCAETNPAVIHDGTVYGICDPI
jgi:hypothetical protein